ncbi:hypothetical protein AX17_006942 [Amanita inopinata Kibby_2008]|nr:hypothetical protein AX17_006942 [Amanita inopinata Kibby_2008]
MRKKNRNLHQEDSIQATGDRSNIYAGRGKRSRAWSVAVRPPITAKKLRTTTNINEEQSLQTPYPSALSDSQVFKLQSSKGAPLSPGQEFSPLPLMPKNTLSTCSIMDDALKRRAYSKPSSTFHKENAIKNQFGDAFTSRSRSRSKSKTRVTGLDRLNSSRSRLSIKQKSRFGLNNSPPDISTLNDLASPFTSRHASANTSPNKDQENSSSVLHSACSRLYKNLGISESNLSKVLFDPTGASDPRHTLTEVHSTTTSPTRSPSRGVSARSEYSGSSTSSRRPSAPSASRPRIDSWSRSLPQISDKTARRSMEPQEMSGRKLGGNLSLAFEECNDGSSDDRRRSSSYSAREKWTWSDAAVDFNRPPSQLSFHSDFFDDVQGISTPLKSVKASQRNTHDYKATGKTTEHRFTGESPSQLSVSSMDHTSIKHPIELSGFFDMDKSWITDSLISPPSGLRARNKDATQYQVTGLINDEAEDSDDPEADEVEDDSDDDYGILQHASNRINWNADALHQDVGQGVDAHGGQAKQKTNATTAEELSSVLCNLGLSVGDGMYGLKCDLSINPLVPMFTCDATCLLARTGARRTTDPIAAENVSMSCLAGNAEANRILTDEIGCDATLRVKKQTKGRNRRETIRASDQVTHPPKPSQALARRKRSGTVVGPSAARRTRSGTIVGPPLQAKIVQHASKERHYEAGTGAPALSMPHELADSETLRHDSGETIVVVDDNDELDLFKEEWIDEDWPWIVADPSSPLTEKNRNKNPRTSWNAKGLSLHKRPLSKSLGADNQEDATVQPNESDDELLLKPGFCEGNCITAKISILSRKLRSLVGFSLILLRDSPFCSIPPVVGFECNRSRCFPSCNSY